MTKQAKTLQEKALEIATSDILNECDGTWLDGFIALNHSIHGVVPEGIVPIEEYEHYNSRQLVNVILDRQALIVSSAQLLFQLAKTSIVEKAMDLTLDDEMTQLNFTELVAMQLCKH
jgi:hypothetical protein